MTYTEVASRLGKRATDEKAKPINWAEITPAVLQAAGILGGGTLGYYAVKKLVPDSTVLHRGLGAAAGAAAGGVAAHSLIDWDRVDAAKRNELAERQYQGKSYVGKIMSDPVRGLTEAAVDKPISTTVGATTALVGSHEVASRIPVVKDFIPDSYTVMRNNVRKAMEQKFLLRNPGFAGKPVIPEKRVLAVLARKIPWYRPISKTMAILGSRLKR